MVALLRGKKINSIFGIITYKRRGVDLALTLTFFLVLTLCVDVDDDDDRRSGKAKGRRRKSYVRTTEKGRTALLPF